MITYNHEKFIAQAIESVLMQQTNFEYEFVIGEDCSTDNTRAIVQDYQKRRPDIIRLLLHEKNVGMRQNGQLTRDACQGDYAAILEGDDYWTSPHKLQKQVDYLDAHPECAITCHRASVLYDGTDDESFGQHWPDGEQSTISDFADVITGRCSIPTCSSMLRRELLDSPPDWFLEMPIGDYPMFALCALHGSVHYSDEVMAVYRRHPTGITASWDWDRSLLNRVLVCSNLMKTSEPSFRPSIRSEIGESAYALSIGYEERGDFANARRFASTRILMRHHRPPLENPVRQYVRLLAPGLHRTAKALKGKLHGA
jgi:glycosyltransferase involved in cell wall biosynthesis